MDSKTNEILQKFSTQKVDLGKVELAVIDDVKKQTFLLGQRTADTIRAIGFGAGMLIDDIMKEYRVVQKSLPELEKTTKKLQQSLKELGITNNKELDNAKNEISKTNKRIKTIEEALNKLVKVKNFK